MTLPSAGPDRDASRSYRRIAANLAAGRPCPVMHHADAADAVKGLGEAHSAIRAKA